MKGGEGLRRSERLHPVAVTDDGDGVGADAGVGGREAPPERWLDAQDREEVPGHRSEEHTSELQSLRHLVCRLLLEKKKEPRSYTGVMTRRSSCPVQCHYSAKHQAQPDPRPNYSLETLTHLYRPHPPNGSPRSTPEP